MLRRIVQGSAVSRRLAVGPHRSLFGPVFAGIVLLAWAGTATAQGIALRSVGPINESMAGVATGCPLDAAGAIHWNPASISGLPCSEMEFGFGLLLPTTELSSRLNPPFGTFSGTDGSEPGVNVLPTMAFVHREEGSPWSFGLGVLGVGGSHVNYPASVPGGTNNPILFPQPTGLGNLSASVDIIQIDPTISYQLTDHLSVGFAPTLTLASLIASPLFLGPANAQGYAGDLGTRYTFGGGFQAGLYYTTDCDWRFGASVKSPQWMEPFRFRTEDSFGRPEEVTFHLDYPLIVSLGASYTGFEKWVIGSDVRYFNYAGTSGFGSGGFNPANNFALTGLDWRDVYSIALGAQRQVGERLFLRMGYCYNDNPITSESAQFNVASPLITQHTIHMGGSYVFADNWLCSLAYVHAFENEVTGPLQPPGSPFVVGSVTSRVSADSLTLGFSKRF